VEWVAAGAVEGAPVLAGCELLMTWPLAVVLRGFAVEPLWWWRAELCATCALRDPRLGS
jgi:hypothetical protein